MLKDNNFAFANCWLTFFFNYRPTALSGAVTRIVQLNSVFYKRTVSVRNDLCRFQRGVTAVYTLPINAVCLSEL